MKKIAIAGNILLDVVKKIDVWPEKGMLVNIVGEEHAVGGCVCNTAIDLKRLSPETEVRVFGRVGRDAYGTFLIDRMRREGLDVAGIRLSDDATSYTDVMTDVRTGERTFFHFRGANAAFSDGDIDIDALDVEFFHLGYLLLLDTLDRADPKFGTRAARLLHDVQSREIKTCIDLVSEQSARFASVIAPALRYCDYAVINEVEASRLSGIDAYENGKLSVGNLEKICRKIRSLGVRTGVVVHCPTLSCADVDGAFTVVSSLDLPDGYIVGSVGAGDAFCAGMLYAFLTDMSAEAGMRLASCAAARNLAVVDSVGGAASLRETTALETIFKRKEILC